MSDADRIAEIRAREAEITFQVIERDIASRYGVGENERQLLLDDLPFLLAKLAEARRQTKRLSAKIARCLFTDGAGKRAQRLVMEHNGALGAGWCEQAMADRIAELLHAAPRPRPKAQERDG